ncbi:MAG: hypothetical protein MHMPM18_004250 [Marteilia pararefringens]
MDYSSINSTHIIRRKLKYAALEWKLSEKLKTISRISAQLNLEAVVDHEIFELFEQILESCSTLATQRTLDPDPLIWEHLKVVIDSETFKNSVNLVNKEIERVFVGQWSSKYFSKVKLLETELNCLKEFSDTLSKKMTENNRKFVDEMLNRNQNEDSHDISSSHSSI